MGEATNGGLVDVAITLRRGAATPSVLDGLLACGLRGHRVLDSLSIVTGRVHDSRVGSLRQVPGVETVEIGRELLAFTCESSDRAADGCASWTAAAETNEKDAKNFETIIEWLEWFASDESGLTVNSIVRRLFGTKDNPRDAILDSDNEDARQAVREVLACAPNDIPYSIQLGAYLRKNRNRVVNGVKLVHVPTKGPADLWNAVPADAIAAAPTDVSVAPEIVCLCGSTRFYEHFQRANYELTMQGKIVLSVGFYPAVAATDHGEHHGCTPEQKLMVDELHLRKIDLADSIFVLNVDGYVGKSTLREIAYAQFTQKNIRYLNEKKGAQFHISRQHEILEIVREFSRGRSTE